ncbi:helix-turn-helix domain-containing protein [Sabulibacter ruber]|uniref:helix-turn-helix domain-containing protein n=1 Tax=Sabulibacter ruber TaxID=2811901 RepID=UPI001A9706C7|nr:AraC family transcriptional regulator [Sabulibacter ruber]
MEGISSLDKKVKEGFIGQRMIVLPPNLKGAASKNVLTRGIYLTAIGFYPHATFHDRERKKGSQQYILLYCVEGRGFVNIDHKVHELAPNSFIIIPKSTPHHYYSLHTDPWSIYWAHFTGELADAIFSRYSNSKEASVMSIPYVENHVNLFNQVISLLENSFGDKEIEIANFNFLHFLTSLVYHKEVNPSAYATDPVNDSIQYMKKHLSRSFSIKELASEQNLSVSYYSELFKKKLGYSPIQYFIQLKIQKSCQFIYFTDKSIKQISTELGFEDPFYFSRMFKKIMGLSPVKYRNLHKK